MHWPTSCWSSSSMVAPQRYRSTCAMFASSCSVRRNGFSLSILTSRCGIRPGRTGGVLLMNVLVVALFTFVFAFLAVPILLGLLRLFGLYTIVQERRCHVYVLFGRVIGVLNEPGLYVLPARLGLSAFLVRWFGRCYVLDMRLDQIYLRSLAVNSEEGAPMGIGIWYE